jgi:hypothetical protein
MNMNETADQLNLIVEDITTRPLQAMGWEHKAAPGKWSKKEIMGHLVDSAQINLQRFVRCTYQENFKLVYEQEEWVKAAHYQEANIGEILALWRLLNRQIIRVLADYPPGRLHAKCDNSRIGESLYTVEWLAQDYIRHLKHHLHQIYGPIN